MRNFFEQDICRWAQPNDSLHVYALPDDALREAVAGYQAVIEPFVACAVQPAPYLHATVQRLPWFRTDLSEAEVDDLADALRTHLAALPAFAVTLGRPLVNDDGVTVHAQRSPEWDALVDTVRRAAVATRGPQPPVGDPPFGPHVSLGYGVADGDGDVLQQALDAVAAPGPLVLRVEAVHLESVDQHPGAGTFTWTELARLPLR